MTDSYGRTVTTRNYVIAHLMVGTACANTFYSQRRQDARNRISELRKDGWQIATVECNLHHHDKRVVMYRLISRPDMPSQQTTMGI